MEFTAEQKYLARNDPVMHDLETLGTRPTSAILSLGACKFDPDTMAITDTFHEVISRESCMEYGLTWDQSTIDWWESQTAEAKAASYSNPNGRDLKLVLLEYKDFVSSGTTVWGNDSDFDNVIMANAYHCTNVDLPWKFWNNRCYRTMKNMFPTIKMGKRSGTHHNALDDAINQATHLMKILAHMRGLQAALG